MYNSMISGPPLQGGEGKAFVNLWYGLPNVLVRSSQKDSIVAQGKNFPVYIEFVSTRNRRIKIPFCGNQCNEQPINRIMLSCK
jgi:hypothetical protein